MHTVRMLGGCSLLTLTGFSVISPDITDNWYKCQGWNIRNTKCSIMLFKSSTSWPKAWLYLPWSSFLWAHDLCSSSISHPFSRILFPHDWVSLFFQSVETLGYVIFSFHFLYYLCLNSIFYVLFGFFLFRQSDSVQLCSLVFPTPLITWCVILSESPSVLCCVQFPSYSLVPGFPSPELFSYVVFC